MTRTKEMKLLREEGWSYKRIGEVFGVSRQYVHQQLSGYGKLLQNLRTENGWYKAMNSAILERDGFKCRNCGGDKHLLVHHIDKNDNHNSLENLMTMCSTCHLKLHRPKEWSVLLQKARGTYERNQFIRQVYKPGQGTKLAKQFKLSRQRINVIVHTGG